MIETQRPLVTLALFAYNQEKYVREAITGAFAQTYSPMQIILSDDSSDDRTFEIINEMAMAYGGNASILARRTPLNSGLASHINQVVSIATGELIVFAAGDDISLPERVEVLVSQWLANGKQSGCYYSAMVEIDSGTNKTNAIYTSSSKQIKGLSHDFVSSSYSVFGASAAWTKDLFDQFGPLLPRVVNEDAALALRAAALGSVNYNATPLVLYRANIGLASNSSDGMKPHRRNMYVPALLVRNYIVFVQKSIDLKAISAARQLIDAVVTRRAEYLFRYRLFNKSRNLSKRKISYFFQRCRYLWIAKELAKWLFPSFITAEEIAQRIMFRIVRS